MLPNEDILVKQLRDTYDQVKAKAELEALVSCPFIPTDSEYASLVGRPCKVHHKADVTLYCPPQKIEECKLLYGRKYEKTN